MILPWTPAASVPNRGSGEGIASDRPFTSDAGAWDREGSERLSHRIIMRTALEPTRRSAARPRRRIERLRECARQRSGTAAARPPCACRSLVRFALLVHNTGAIIDRIVHNVPRDFPGRPAASPPSPRSAPSRRLEVPLLERMRPLIVVELVIDQRRDVLSGHYRRKSRGIVRVNATR